jgi:hypothetical protein
MKKPAVLILQAYFLYCLSIAKKIMKRTSKKTCVTKSYFDGKMLDLWVQQNGQNRYNDQLQFEMTASFRKINWLFLNIKPQTEKGSYLTPEEKTVMKL